MNTRLRGLANRVPGHPFAKAVVALVVLVTFATLVSRPTAGPGPSASPGRTAPIAAGSPAASPATTPTMPAPTATPEPWEDLILGPAVVTAALAPDREDSTGVATGSQFTIRSLTGTPAIELAAGVLAQPPVDFLIVEGATPDEAILQPSEPLLEGQTYRLRLIAPDGSLGGSWAFRTQRPLNVVGTIPGDESTEVPVDTGIEVTFDQDGTTGLEPHFRIEPAVAGRFEQHGRTWAFVPNLPLELASAYRVTVTRGVPINGSDQVLEADVSFRFETRAKVATTEMRVDFASPFAAIRPGQQPALPLYADYDDERETTPPGTLPVRIFRLPDLATTAAAAERLTGSDSWLRTSGAGLVPTDDLVRVARLDAPLLIDRGYTAVLSIPVRLDPGAYLVVVPRQARTAQLLLQVSNLGVYAVTTDTTTLAWVNNLASVAPVPGATVSTITGQVLGTTDGEGLAQFPTPDELRPPPAKYYWEGSAAHIVSIVGPDGRWVVAGLGSRISWLDGRYDNSSSRAAEPSNRWWLLLHTDRSEYRQTDTIHAWGLVRPRDGGALPSNVEVRLHAIGNDDGETSGRVPIARVPATLSPRGVFAADIPIAGLPRASYTVDLYVGDVAAASQWITVADIRKPSFRLDVEADRYAYRDGQTVSITIRASFFDGSTVPALDLRVESSGDSGETTVTRDVTTDATGTARIIVPATFDYDRPSGWSSQSIYVSPVRPEEGEITGGTDVAVFPSAAWLTGEASLTGTTLAIDGRLTRVAFEAIDAAQAAGTWDWPYDAAAGRPLGGHEVTASVVRLEEVRGRAHTSYDYLEKRVTTWYEYDTVERTVGTYRTQTNANGRYHLPVSVPAAKDDYQIVVRSTDPSGRPVLEDLYAGPRIDPGEGDLPSYLLPSSCGFSRSMVVGLDSEATVTLHDGDGTPAGEGRFLFLVASRGLREATASDDSTYSRLMADSDLPGFTIRAVQVTGQGYTVADAGVDVDVDDLTVDVRLEPDRRRYAPGDQVTIDVTTLGPDGLPVAADVVVQGVDEKLFAIGAAQEVDVLADLHQSIGSGFLQSFASHRIPNRQPENGCGATGGGREAFGDVVTAQLIRTGTDGRGTVSFKLLDDLTSWHLTALALTDGLRAGSGSLLIPVSLPFFVESVLAPDYLVGDAPVLRVRAYGEALDAGDPVRFTVSAPSLGLAETTVDGRAFEAIRVPLPALPAGEHRVRVEGRGPAGGLTDAVIRVIHVVPSRLAGLVTRYDTLTAGYVADGGEGLTTYAIVDAGRGSLISKLLELATTNSARFDRQAAAEIARGLLIDEFAFDPNGLPETGFDAARYQPYGIALLPYSSADPELSALAALVIPGRVSVDSLRRYLREHAGEPATTRESQVMVLAGLAGLGDDVLAELRALSAEQLTIRESLWLALGLTAAGDENGARAIERDLLEKHGERFGPWVRLAVGNNIDDTLDAARLLLVLSARLGEPFARDVARYLLDHPTREHSLALEQLAYAQASLDRLPRTAGRFAWTVAGERHEVELEPGGAYTLVLTAGQRATLRLEPLAGGLEVVSSWSSSTAELPRDGPVTITRTVTPANNAPDDRLVRVQIRVSFTALATTGCWQITDLAPSGLAPIERSREWPDDFSPYVSRPYEIDGQRVEWCAWTDGPERTFVYSARVVSPGTYLWEPAIIQSVDAPELGAATEPFTFTIR